MFICVRTYLTEANVNIEYCRDVIWYKDTYGYGLGDFSEGVLVLGGQRLPSEHLVHSRVGRQDIQQFTERLHRTENKQLGRHHPAATGTVGQGSRTLSLILIL